MSTETHGGGEPPVAERGLRDLTWRDWRAVLVRAALDMSDDAAPLLSAGVAFYMFLSLFPGLLAALSLYAVVADPRVLEQQVDSLLGALPADARTVLAGQLHTLVVANDRGLSPRLGLPDRAGAVHGAGPG